MGPSSVGSTAREIAAAVRAGEARPVEVLREHLEQIERLDRCVGAFMVVRGERAEREADRLAERPDLAELPLAGVPVAIKDNVAVEGEPMRDGSRTTRAHPQPADHVLVARLHASGAVVVGITRMPELAVFGTTDGAFGITRNPWNLARVPGGSSGGAAAAVASAMVPVAQANDGMGSIRIPSACCGVFGIKPGPGLLPWGGSFSDWLGMAAHGSIATTVGDAAVALSVMAERPDLAEVRPPGATLRVAVSTRAPAPWVPVGSGWKAAAREAGEALASSGHVVTEADPPYAVRHLLANVFRWFAGTDEDAARLDRARLERRNRMHARLGALVVRRGWVRDEQRTAWRRALAGFFARHDVLITPALARTPPRAVRWSERSWPANLNSDSRFAPLAAPWNLAGYPAAAVPMGTGSDGMPLSVQVVAPEGHEARVLAVAALLEELRPWRRQAPLAAVGA